ncbi:MAG: NAD(P)-dependent oxidoreductase [Alphaproteobacteria bacterium]|nr:NAD(P)-dependent oxidoreductase [Alphaproteobacteria bacterium]MBF0332054.1 NAD(P)-dependent oxidoreductase [Alphaproteobacteria bacterium]
MKTLVFGGSGFLGGYVVDELVARGHHVTIFDRKRSPWRPDLAFVEGDILDRAAVRAVTQGFDYVYNFAGAANLDLSIRQPVDFLELNIIGNVNVVDACRHAGVRRFVYASSAYGLSRKGAFYGTSKRCSERIIEQYHEEFGLEFTIIRYGSVYGERADASNRIYRLLRQALTERRIVFPGDGAEEREYIHGHDCAKLSVDLLADEYKNQSFILTGVERFSYAKLLDMINEIMGGRLDIQYLHQDYKGHYTLTPYSFTPSLGKKITTNPCIDFGQGLLHCVETMHANLAPEEVG